MKYKGYVVIIPSGWPWHETHRFFRRESVQCVVKILQSIGYDKTWKDLYKEGYRCKRCTLEVSE